MSLLQQTVLVTDTFSPTTGSLDTSRLAAELDWLSQACDRAVDSADGIELASADIVKKAAIASCGGNGEGDTDDGDDDDDGRIERFFTCLVEGLKGHVASVSCELQISRRRPSPADCVAAAWWLTMVVLAASRRSAGDPAARPRIVVLLQPMTTKWQLVVTELGETMAKAAHRVANALPGITEHVSGAHGCQGGRWGSLVYLRFAAETRPPTALPYATRSRVPAPSVTPRDEAVWRAPPDRRAS